MPAIGPVSSAERPGFYRKTLSQAYCVPKAPRCCFPILRVDRTYPGLGMRPDEIEGLAGVSKPNLIHEIRCPIRLERPGGYREMLQQPNLELQLRVRSGKFSRSLRDPLIEFVGDPLLFTEKPCFFKPDGCLIRRDVQKKSLGLSRELRAPSPGYDYADVALQSQWQGHDRNVFASNGVPCQRRPFLRLIPQPAVEHLADFLRSGNQFSRWSDSHHLAGRVADWFFQPYIHEVEIKHAQERVEQGMHNLGCLCTSPHGRKGENADQIVITALKALDLVGRMFEWPVHLKLPPQARRSAGRAAREAHSETSRAVQRTDCDRECRR